MHLNQRSVISWLAISLLTLSYGCNRSDKLVVQPISEDFNHEYLTGGLDTNFFNTHDVMQYYEVSKYGGLPNDQILTQLDSFATATFPARKLDQIQTLTLLFYKKKLFTDYRDHLYESAMDNENRRLEGYTDDLVAAIIFERLKENPKYISFNRLIYNENNKLQIDATDTILVR